MRNIYDYTLEELEDYFVSHDDKKFRDLIFSGNNNYKDMLAAIKIDIDSVNYEKEVTLLPITTTSDIRRLEIHLKIP